MVADRKLRVELTAKDKTKRAFGSVQKSLGKLKSSLFNIKALIGAAFAAVAIRALKNFVTNTLDAADALAKTSRAIGLTTDTLQELRFAADLGGVSTEKLDASLLKFTKTIGETRAGTGALITFLKNSNVELLNSIQNASSFDEAFDLVTKTLRETTSATDRAALANAAFGRSGSLIAANMIPSLEEVRQKFRDLGLTISADLLFKAEETNDAMTVLSATIRNNFTKAVLENADAILFLVDKFGQLIAHSSEFLQSYGSDEEASIGELSRRAERIKREIDRLLNADTVNIGGLETGISGGFFDGEFHFLDDIGEKLIELEVHLEKIHMLIEKKREAEKPLAEHFLHIPEAVVAVEKLNKVYGDTRPILETLIPVVDETAKRHEEFRQNVDELAKSLDDTLASSLADAATNFESFRDVAKAALRDVLRALIQFVNAQAGLGSGGGLFGSLIKTGLGQLFPTAHDMSGAAADANQFFLANHGITHFAKGGSIAGGQPAIVGEKGAELFVPRQGGNIIPNNALGGVTVNQTINVSTGVQATVRAEVTNMLPQIAAQTREAVLSAKQRGGAFANAFS